MKSSLIAEDILNKINKDFDNEEEKQLVLEVLKEVAMKSWNVGTDQLLRSIVSLLQGQISGIDRFKRINDPRDIIQLAEDKLGNL